MRLSSKAIAACALLSFSPLSFAAVYGGGSGMFTEYKYEDVKSGFGGSAFLGYRPEEIPLVFEVAYLSTGKSKIGNTGVDLSFSGQTFSLGYFGKIDRQGSGVFGKVGYYTGKSKLSDNTGSIKETSSGAMFSVGVDWMLTPNFGFRADIGSLFSVKDLPGLDSSHKSNVTTANLGVLLAFGGSSEPSYRSRSAPAPVYSPPVPAPVYSVPADAPVYSPAVVPTPVAEAPVPPPAPAVAPAPEVAPVAAAPAPSSSSAKGSAQLVPGAVLRSGPSMKSAAIRTLPDGGSVKLLKRETNAEGPWWSVQLEDGTTGWMIEWGLSRISKP